MYKMFCESYRNYIEDFAGTNDDARLKTAGPLYLITDEHIFIKECEANSTIYKLLCDVLYYAQQHITRFPRIAAFLWTIESRGMKPKYFGSACDEDLEAHVKLIHSFLKLAYWY